MPGPLLTTKLFVPRRRRGLVARPRLLEALRRADDARLVLVSAPAGFGKTTLLAEWLHEPPAGDARVAWLSLDPSDNEPRSFWTYVLSALQQAVPGVGAMSLELLQTPSVSTEDALRPLVNELAAGPDDVWLVLDDYHLVDAAEIREDVTFLLEHLPPRLHVVLSTRADPDLPLSRWRARGELVEVRAAELRFTLDEAAAYLEDATGRHLAAQDVAALEERTEGWIAALQLAALSMRGREDVGAFIARFAGDDRYIVDYLVEEVLGHEPDSVREFLLQSSVLDRLTGSLCDAVTGRDDGADVLRTLERANLFIVPLDDRREWYRYHHLFADVLRARLLAERPDLVPVLHQNASRWYAEHDLLDEAVGHALAAQDYVRAVYLMELAVPAVRRNRQDATMLRWLDGLPDDAVRRSPVLSVYQGYLLLAAGDLDAVTPRLDDAEQALARGPDETAPWADTDELHTLPATIAVHRASVAQARGDVAGTAEQARRALELAGPTDHLARAGAAGFLGLAAWAQGDVSTALATFGGAVASLHAAGNLADELSGTLVLADLWVVAGRPSHARRLYEQSLRVANAQGEPVPRATADLYVGLAEIEYEAGDLGEASRLLERADGFDQRVSMTESRYRWFVATARIAAAQGDSSRADSLLDRAEQLYRPGFLPDVRPVAATRARVWIAQGDLARAAGWAAGRGVAVTDEVGYLREFDHLTLVRLLIARHREDPDPTSLEQAQELLARLRAAAEATGRLGSVLEIGMLTALAHDAQGHRPEAIHALGQAWAQAPEPEGFVRLFLDEGGQGERLRGLVAPGRPGSGSEPLTERELEVLRLLDTELTGPQIASRLFISQNTMRTHTKHIFTKLDVTNRLAAVRRGREQGLL